MGDYFDEQAISNGWFESRIPRGKSGGAEVGPEDAAAKQAELKGRRGQ